MVILPVAMNNLHFTFFAKLTQRRCNVLTLKSRRRCEFDVVVTLFDVAITASMIYCEENLLSKVEAKLRQHGYSAVNFT